MVVYWIKSFTIDSTTITDSLRKEWDGVLRVLDEAVRDQIHDEHDVTKKGGAAALRNHITISVARRTASGIEVVVNGMKSFTIASTTNTTYPRIGSFPHEVDGAHQ